MTPRSTRVLAGLLATLALLLAGPLAADSPAAISKAKQADKAAGQASFFCYAWQCRSKFRTAATFWGGTFRTVWKLNYPKNVLWHGECKTYALMSIDVSSTGGVRSRMIRCG